MSASEPSEIFELSKSSVSAAESDDRCSAVTDAGSVLWVEIFGAPALSGRT
jgi:hypothetical protein